MNEEVRSRVRCKKNMERKLNLFGHICRMKDNRLVKEVMFGMMQGQMKRGRNGWMTSRNGAEKMLSSVEVRAVSVE